MRVARTRQGTRRLLREDGGDVASEPRVDKPRRGAREKGNPLRLQGRGEPAGKCPHRRGHLLMVARAEATTFCSRGDVSVRAPFPCVLRRTPLSVRYFRQRSPQRRSFF